MRSRRSARRRLRPPIAALVFCLALFGAGSKAGLVPLHIWLPLAHPAAPSHVSALMSGVMTKVAVYGFVRIVFDLLGTPGVVVEHGGARRRQRHRGHGHSLRDAAARPEKAARLQHGREHRRRLRRPWPCAGVQGERHAGAAALAATAALFHVFNHATFKSLLFFGAGAVLNATGERDIEKLGGLIHRMPHTAFAFLIGCVAISALPPLNGFVSEWLTFQAILLSPELPQWGLKFTVPAAGALLALSAALAAACFVRAFGMTFLGRPRTPVAERAQEIDRFSLAAMFAFAALCLLAGILPGIVIDGLAPVVQSIVGARMPVQISSPWLSIVPVVREPQLLQRAARVRVLAADRRRLPPIAIHRVASQRAAPRAAPGIAAIPIASPATQYSADSFAQPIRRVFGTVVFRAREQVEMPPPADPRPARLAVALAGSDLRLALRAGRARRDGRGRAAQCAAVPHHPAVSQPRLLRARLAAHGARPMAVILDLAVQGAQMLLVLLLAPLLTGLTRKVQARILSRRGPPLLQPYRDLIRLLRKDAVLAENASWLFRVIPYIVFAATWVAAALVPDLRDRADLLLVGRHDRDHRVSGDGALLPRARRPRCRHQLRRHRIEPRGDDRLARRARDADDRVHARADRRLDPALDRRGLHGVGQVGLRVSLGLALVALIMVALAENARIPVDNPATHLELTMVHEAMVLEYSARHLALIELAASLKLLLYISLIACVFVPWGIAPAGAGLAAYAIGFAAYLAQARGRRRPARGLRDLDRQDARIPRAAVPRRGADARPARDAAALRVGRL